MDELTATKRRLSRSLKEVERLETIIEDRSRSLYLAQGEVKDSAAFIERVLNTLSSALLVAAPDGTLTQINKAGHELLGLTDDLAIRPRRLDAFFKGVDCTTDEGRAALMGEPSELTLTQENGVEVPVLFGGSELISDDGRLQAMVCIATDIRDRKMLEIELRHAQKLESVGQLAAGVAHEINTPIQFVGDSITFLKEAFEDMAPVMEAQVELRRAAIKHGIALELVTFMQGIEEDVDLEFLQSEIPKAFRRSVDGIKKVADIVSAMKSFAHPGSAEMMPADINEAIKTTLTVAKNEYRYIAEIETDLAELAPLTCHVGGINQVLLNLIVNGSHAIEDQLEHKGDRGLIRIATLDEEDSILISVEDSGTGIPEEVRSRVFDPFLTTKAIGKGTGQGLPLARSIVVERHGGSIWFETVMGQGTTFFVRLPKQQGEIHAAA